MSVTWKRIIAAVVGAGVLLSVSALAQATGPTFDQADFSATAQRNPTVRTTKPVTENDPITITGRNFTRGELVTVSVSQTGMILATEKVKVRRDGRFSVTVRPREPWRVAFYRVYVDHSGGDTDVIFSYGNPDPNHSPYRPVLRVAEPSSADGTINILGNGLERYSTYRLMVRQDMTSVVPIDQRVTTDGIGSFVAGPIQAKEPWVGATNYTIIVWQDNKYDKRTELQFTTPAF